MSYERRVMPSDGILDILLQEVTPVVGKGALGHGGSTQKPLQDTMPDRKNGKQKQCYELTVNRIDRGVCEQALKLHL